MTTDVQQTALAALSAGLSPLPIQAGGKVPIGEWKQYQTRPMDATEVDRMFRNGCNIGLVCGAVSGNLECIDFDEPDLLRAFRDTLEGVNPDLRHRLAVWQETCSSGFHLLYRVNGEVGGNQALAKTAPYLDENGKKRQNVLIETRGRGGYFLLAPSRAVRGHGKDTDGLPYPYVLHGDLAHLPTISEAERDLIHSIARSFDESGHQEQAQPHQGSTRPTGTTGTRPGDRFNAETDWSALLSGYGWRYLKTVGDRHHWQRPGKTGPEASATLRHDIEAGFWCFSTSTPLPEEKPLSKFAVFAYTEHHGDFAAAARALAARYGMSGQGREEHANLANDFNHHREGWAANSYAEAQPAAIDPAAILGGFEVKTEYVEKLGKEEFLIENLLIRQHILVCIAMSGGGKTAFWYRHAAPVLARKGYTVWYLDCDSPASEHRAMKEIADQHGFRFLNPDANAGKGIDDLKGSLEAIANGECDLTGNVFIFDTLKKFLNLMKKESAKAFFVFCRKLTGKGATVVLLGHANKYRSKPEGHLIAEGVGDVRSDTDELIFFERKRNEQDGGVDVTTDCDPDHGAKVRGLFEPFSFHIAPDRAVTVYEKPIEVPDYTQTATLQATEEEIIDAAAEFLAEAGEPVAQSTLVNQVRAMTGAGAERIRRLIVANSAREGGEGRKRFAYTVGARGRLEYSLPQGAPEQGELFDAGGAFQRESSFSP